jgi:hypothetical protein
MKKTSRRGAGLVISGRGSVVLPSSSGKAVGFSTTPSCFSDDFPENQAMNSRTSLTKHPKD